MLQVRRRNWGPNAPRNAETTTRTEWLGQSRYVETFGCERRRRWRSLTSKIEFWTCLIR